MTQNAPVGTASGRQARLYMSEVLETPSWVAINRVKGHKCPMGKKAGTANGRDLKAEINLPGALTVGPLSFQYRHKRGATDDVRADLYDSWVNDTPFLFLITDSDKAHVNAAGYTFPMMITKFDITAEDENAIVYDVEAVYVEAYDDKGNLVELDEWENAGS